MTMIGYVTLGASDLEQAKTFYAALLAPFGASQLLDAGRIVFYGVSMDEPMLAVCTPYDEEGQHPGNGTMVAFHPGSKEKVDEMYHHALSLGATCDGEPGQRIPDMFYGAYVRDADGNKIAFYEFG